MWIILDIIIVAILVVFAVIGAKKGLIRSLSGVAVTLVALVLTLVFSSPLADFFRTTVIYHSLVDRVNTKISDYVDESAGADSLRGLFGEEMPQGIDDMLKSFGTSGEKVGDKCDELIAAGADNVRSVVCDYIVSPAAEAISKALAVIAVFIGSVIVLKLLAWLIGLIFKLPLLDGVNKFGGFLFGLVMGLVVCCLFCSAVGIALPYLRGAGIGIDEETVKNAVIFSAVDRINPLSFMN